MALTITIEGRGVITDAESTTDWGVSGSGGISATQETDLVLQGTYAVSCKSSGNKYAWLYFDESASGTALNVSSGGAEEGELIYIWFNCTTIGALDTLANEGFSIRLGSGTTNYSYWSLGGYSGGNQFGNNYTGGWMCAVIDPTTPPTGTNGTGLSLSNVSHIGIHINTLGSSKSENLIIDTIACGKGLRITGTDATGWQEVSDYCNAFASRAWGMFQEKQGIYFVYGNMFVGDSAQTAVTSLTDEGRVFRFGDFEYYDGSNWVSAIRDDFNGITIEDAASYTTTLEDGVVVGTDGGRSGSTFIGSEDSDTIFDLYGGSSAASVTKLYGSTLSQIRGGITFGNDADFHCYSVSFSGCGTVDPVGAPKLRNCIFQGTVDPYDESMAAAIADDGGSQTDETTASNNATADDMTLVPATPAVNDAYYFGSKYQFESLDVFVSTVGATFVVAWEYYNGSWTALSGVIDQTNNFRNSGRNRVHFTWPTDWATTTVNSQGPFYFVRARVTTGGGTQATGQQSWVKTTSSGAALLWNANIDIEDSNFIANTHDENSAHAIEHPTAGSFSYDGLTFSGNDFDVANAVDATTTDSYSETNRNTDQALGNGTIIGAGQSLTGDGNVLSRARFFLSKTLSPTGDITAKLYAHTGTFGTDGTPTGSAVATSNTVSAAGLTTTPTLTDFEFEDEFTLVNTTKYFVVLEYSGGDASNYVNVGVDTTTPGHGGNFATLTGSTWTAAGGTDGCFYVFTGAIVTIGNLPGSDAATAEEIGDPPGATIIESTVTLKVTVKDESGTAIQNAQTAIYKVSDSTQLMNEDTTALGVAEEDFNYPGSPVPVTVRVRKGSSGVTKYVPVKSSQTISASGLDITITMRVDTNNSS